MSEAPLYLQGMKKGKGAFAVYVKGYITENKTHPPRTPLGPHRRVFARIGAIGPHTDEIENLNPVGRAG